MFSSNSISSFLDEIRCKLSNYKNPAYNMTLLPESNKDRLRVRKEISDCSRLGVALKIGRWGVTKPGCDNGGMYIWLHERPVNCRLQMGWLVTCELYSINLFKHFSLFLNLLNHIISLFFPFIFLCYSILLCNPGWPWTHDPLASTSWVLGS